MPPEPLSDVLARLRALVVDPEVLVRAVGSGHRKVGRPPWRRVELRWVDLRAGRHLQVTGYDQTQAHTRNAPAGPDADALVEELFDQPYAHWHVWTPDALTQLRVTKRGGALVSTRPAEATAEPGGRPGAHDRVKNRLLDPADPWLVGLGISDRDGQVKPTRQAKLRQVEEFLRLLAGSVDAALDAGHLRTPTVDDPLRVVDLGCGNAYLTFAAHRWLSQERGLEVSTLGVDVRPAARDRNQQLAASLVAERLTFADATIAAASVDPWPDVVLALHACDTATDEALARAVGWQVPIVLAAPCCHLHLQAQLRGRPAPSPYGLLTRHGILRERLADTLTDTLRATLLRLHGYRVDVVEFVASAHTPRNTLLRAVRTGAAPDPAVQADYDALVAQWQVTPRLAELLAAA